MHTFPDLTNLLLPKSIVIIGASDKPGGIGQMVVANLLEKSQYEGEVHLVNPARDKVAGRKAHRRIIDVPGTPDVAVIAIPADHVLSALEDCARHGIPYAIVLTSGFGETGPTGGVVQSRMREIADRTGMRIYGPNSPGLTNIADGIGMTFSPAFGDDRRPGPVGVATHGGGLGRNLIQTSDRGAGVSLWASLGNAADLDVSDFIHHMAQDERIDVIATLLEGIRGGDLLVASLMTAASAAKPVVTLKIGRSEYGIRAAESHTAAMAGSADVNSAIFAQLGAVEVEDTDELMDVAWLLTRANPGPRTRVAVYGGSGGAGALAVDLLGTVGLELAELTDETKTILRSQLPPFAAIDNPVDLTANVLSDNEATRRTLAAICADPQVDVVLLPMPLDYGERTAEGARAIADCQAGTDTPILPVWMSDRRGPGWQVLADADFCTPRSLTKAVTAVSRWAAYGRWRNQRDRSHLPVPLILEAPKDRETLPRVDTEPAAKAWLRGAGIPVPEGVVADTPEEAMQFTRQLGDRCVQKIVSPDIGHKSDVGGVETAVRVAHAADSWRRITRNVADAVPVADLQGVLIEQMADHVGVDLLVGVHRDSTFGHLISVGLGGVHVEILDDVQPRLLPLDRVEARAMVDGLRSRALLDAARGRGACDVEALVDLLLQVSDLVSRHADDIQELDLNPVRVGVAGDASPPVIVLDALVVRSNATLGAKSGEE